jgi:paraquat-inducible protein B
MSLAVTKRKKSVIILAWIAPIAAIIISISMLYEHYTKVGNSIEITFKNITGLDVRQSHIQFNGLQIGDINSIRINEKDINKFIVKATIYSDYNYLIKKGSLFYKVAPKLSLNGVSDLSNVLKGNYIELVPASKSHYKLKKLKQQSLFKGYDTEPKAEGVIFTLKSNSGDFDITSAILYKGLQIGEILDKSIDEFTINYKVLIYNKYKYLISSQSKFYKINPLEFQATLENVNLTIPSLKNMISSAIGFTTSSTDKHIKESYMLFDSKNEILLNETNTHFYSFKILANNISKNDSIYYKGILVGKIDTVKISKNTNIVYGHIKEKYKYLINNSTVFYQQKAISSTISTEGIQVELSNIKDLLMGGLTFITPTKKEKLTNITFTYYDDINKFYQKDKFNILLTLKDNFNIKKTSKLYYKNIKIGSIKSINLEKDIMVKIMVDTKYKYLFGKNSKIYLKGTKISLNKIENLSSIILGDKFYLIADKNNGYKSQYTLDSVNPNKIYYEKGLRVHLKAKESKNITIGSPIYYKGFEVGEIYDADLTKDGESIIFELFIQEKYANILKTTSKFYKATTIDMDVGLFGAKIKLGSAKSMLKGGIIFINEKTTKEEKSATDSSTFNLLEKKE